MESDLHKFNHDFMGLNKTFIMNEINVLREKE